MTMLFMTVELFLSRGVMNMLFSDIKNFVSNTSSNK